MVPRRSTARMSSSSRAIRERTRAGIERGQRACPTMALLDKIDRAMARG